MRPTRLAAEKGDQKGASPAECVFEGDLRVIDEILQRAEHALPAHVQTIRRIGQVRREASSRPYEEFFEPKSVFTLSGNTPRLIGISLPDVVAWTKHMTYATRVRMLALEPPILVAISSGALTPAVVLLRSHAETAGLACLALLTLRDATPERLRDLMQRTLFGSALARGWERFPDLASLLPLSASQPLSAKNLMDALDRFADAGREGNSRYSAVYGLLCDYAHPNSRSVRGFARTVESALGWEVRYSPTETTHQSDETMVLSILFEVMRLGYSASEFLRHGTVFETEDGFCITPPPPAALERILTKLMLCEDGPEL